ncbi:MAG: AMP-dependent synthetase/ligase [Candidatus Dormibacteraceae bacterium]
MADLESVPAGAPAAAASPAEIRPDAISERTVPGIFYRQAARRGDRTLIHHHDGRRWREVSWADARRLTLNTAAQLVRAGVGAGDRVVIMSENCLEWVYCDLAIQSAGAVTVPIYATTAADTAQEIAADCGARLAIASDQAGAGLSRRGPLERIVGIEEELPGWGATEAQPADLAEVRRRLEALGPEDVATLVYTSGTTGRPKGVVLPQRCFADMAASSLEVFDIGEDDVSLSFLPYAHILERMDGIVVGIAAGGSTYLSRGMSRLAEDLQEARPTIMVGVPRIYEKVYDLVHDRVRGKGALRRAVFRWAVAVGRRRAAARRPGPILSIQHSVAERLVLRGLHRRITGGRLRFFVSGGAPLSREVESFFWATGVRILQGWGLTETTSGATSNTETDHRFETVGKPLPGVGLRLAEDGEIMVRGPGIMTGYHGRPQETAEVLEEGWLRTGDIGSLDADGFLTITDRKKDLIKTAGGKYVAPQPVESRLEDDRLILRAFLIGDQRPYVTALIVPDWEGLAGQEGITGDPSRLVGDERVRGLIQARVETVNRGRASFETIKYFTVLPEDFSEESGEVTPTLKVKRRVIVARHADEIEAMYRAGAASHASTEDA